ncbi:hypothetical protein A2U01_0079394, partial [Trifolium medium]|nr:hypothetical protein [Trifolium medium]
KRAEVNSEKILSKEGVSTGESEIGYPCPESVEEYIV